MKAIVYTEYGNPDVLKIQEIEKPTPKENEVLIRVRAISVNFGDLMARDFGNISAKEFNMPFLLLIFARFILGFRKPKIKVLGNSFSGIIEDVGNGVKQFQKGDQVFGYSGEKMGAYSEYLCMHENGILAVKPANMSFEESSIVPYGATMAGCILKKVNIQKGQKVLIIGASGGIGSAVVQFAKHHFGAEVDGVCGTNRTEFVKNLGADTTLNYEKEDFTKQGKTYDLIFDTLGKTKFSSCKTILNSNGIYLAGSFKTKKLLQMAWTSIFGKKKLICTLAIPQKEDLLFVKKLIDEGKYKSIIGKSFTLEQTAEAHKYAESKERKGEIVISVI